MEQSGDQYDDKRPLQWLQIREWSPVWSGIQCRCMQWYYIYSKVLANIQFPGLIISGGTDRRSTEIFPAQISCAIPSFPDEGNLSIFILIFVFAIHFDPKSWSAGATPFPLSTMVGILFCAAARKPASLASPGTRGSSPTGRSLPPWGLRYHWSFSYLPTHNPLLSKKRRYHAAVVTRSDTIILVGGIDTKVSHVIANLCQISLKWKSPRRLMEPGRRVKLWKVSCQLHICLVSDWFRWEGGGWV